MDYGWSQSVESASTSAQRSARADGPVGVRRNRVEYNSESASLLRLVISAMVDGG